MKALTNVLFHGIRYAIGQKIEYRSNLNSKWFDAVVSGITVTKVGTALAVKFYSPTRGPMQASAKTPGSVRPPTSEPQS